MIRFTAVVAQFTDLPDRELQEWIDRGWILPQPAEDDEPLFAEIDVARIRLIRDLRHDMGVDEETIPLVLGLLDQVYGLRRTLRTVARALDDGPEDVRRAVLAAMRG